MAHERIRAPAGDYPENITASMGNVNITDALKSGSRNITVTHTFGLWSLAVKKFPIR